MITSLDIVHELLTSIYTYIFSNHKNNINKYDILLYLNDYYYFDLLKNISKDINELDKSFTIIEKDNFNEIVDNICKERNYVIKDRKYENENEKKIEFLHDILSDLLCLLIKNNNKKNREIKKVYMYETNYIENIKKYLKDIDDIKKRKQVTDNENNNDLIQLNEQNINNILNIKKTDFKNDDIIIKYDIDNNTQNNINKILESYNIEYESRYYYMFLNYYLTVQTMFTSNLINLYSDQIKNIINTIINVKNQKYIPLNIYDILSFQYEQIKFYKCSHENIISPVKKVKIVNTVERGGDPYEHLKKNGNLKTHDSYEKKSHKQHFMAKKKYKAKNYFDSRHY